MLHIRTMKTTIRRVKIRCRGDAALQAAREGATLHVLALSGIWMPVPPESLPATLARAARMDPWGRDAIYGAA